MFATKGKTAVTVAIGLILFSGTATADPSSAPDANDIVGVGAETHQYVINTAAMAYTVSHPNVRLASFNAIRPGTESNPVCADEIVIRDPDQVTNSGDEFTVPRPCGSVAGINALLTTPELDFARSSVYLGANPAYASLYFIPVLNDAVSYIVDKAAGSDIRNLTRPELADIYRCTDLRGYHPKLPFPGTGTRIFFLQEIGLADSEVGACVDQSVTPNQPGPVAGDPLALMPFSVPRWSVHPPAPANPPSAFVDIAATTLTPNAFYAERTLYNVVRRNDYDAAGSPLPAIFGPDIPGSSNSGGYFCDRFANIGLARQGFRVAPNCGL